MSKYLIQVHGEWSGIPEYSWMDIDMEADTLDEVRELVDKEIPAGVIYQVWDDEKLLVENTKND